MRSQKQVEEKRRDGFGRAATHWPGKSQRQGISFERKGNGGSTVRAVGGSEVDQGHNTRISGGTPAISQFLAVLGGGVPTLKRSCLSPEAVGKRSRA